MAIGKRSPLLCSAIGLRVWIVCHALSPMMTSPLPVTRVLAPNPGPFTLEGTNTWIVGHDPAVVIDPGPADEGHLASVNGAARAISLILLTHHHPDHAARYSLKMCMPFGVVTRPEQGSALRCRMAWRQVVSERIVGRISPAAVWIENRRASVQPARRR